MIDLAAYDLRPLSERLRRIRSARDFRERQALLEAVDSAGASGDGAPLPCPLVSIGSNPCERPALYGAARSVAWRGREAGRRMGHAPAGKRTRRRSLQPAPRQALVREAEPLLAAPLLPPLGPPASLPRSLRRPASPPARRPPS